MSWYSDADLIDVLVIGAGAREHALVWKLLLSPKVERVYVAPGNGGTSSLAMPLPYDANNAANINLLANWVSQREIGFILVGPEVPLAEGVVDVFNAMQQPIVGPTQVAARIESSKDWAKQFMLRHNIPTAQAITFTEFEPLRQHLLDPNTTYPLVIKEDGLMAGKGVTIARSRNAAAAWLAHVAGTTIDRVVAADFVPTLPGTAAALPKVLVEEYLEGVEVSIHAFSDGKAVKMMPPVCDYKTIGDGDSGPMTGGMGAYSPTSHVSATQLDWIREHIIEAAIKGMAAEGHSYKGILYAGLMMTAAGPKVLEFNSRFGDPETQVLMMLLESDLVDICDALIEGRLAEQEVLWSSDACVALVLAAPGYPDAPVTGQPIQGLDKVEPRVRVFHAGTRGQVRTDSVTPNDGVAVKVRSEAGQIEMYTAGGRVLSVAAAAPTLAEARALAYRNAALINFPGKQMRSDIALREVVPTAEGVTNHAPIGTKLVSAKVERSRQREARMA